MNSQHTYEFAINASWTPLSAIPSFYTTVQVPFNKISNLRFVEGDPPIPYEKKKKAMNKNKFIKI